MNLETILLSILTIVVIVGIIRVIFRPFTNFLDFIVDLFLLDLLGDVLKWIFETIFD